MTLVTINNIFQMPISFELVIKKVSTQPLKDTCCKNILLNTINTTILNFKITKKYLFESKVVPKCHQLYIIKVIINHFKPLVCCNLLQEYNGY